MRAGMKKIDRSIDSWTAVNTMINHPEAKLTSISYQSRTGFIFLLTVPVSDTEFLDLPNDKHKYTSETGFTEPVVTVVLKISLLSDECREVQPFQMLTMEGSNSYEKQCDTLDRTYHEAKRQQQTYITTLVPNGSPICPAVADFSYFSKSNTPSLLEQLGELAFGDTSARAMINYLATKQDKPFELAVMTMTSVPHAQTFFESNPYRESNKDPVTEDEYDCFAKNCVALLYIIFIKTGNVPLDAHEDNFLCTMYDFEKQRDELQTFEDWLQYFGRTRAQLIDLSDTYQFFDTETGKSTSSRTPYPYKNEYAYLFKTEFDKDFKEIALYLDAHKGVASILEQTTDLSDDVLDAQLIKIFIFMMRVDHSHNFGKFGIQIARPQAMQLLIFMVGEEIDLKIDLTSTQIAHMKTQLIDIKHMLRLQCRNRGIITIAKVEEMQQNGDLYQLDATPEKHKRKYKPIGSTPPRSKRTRAREPTEVAVPKLSDAEAPTRGAVSSPSFNPELLGVLSSKMLYDQMRKGTEKPQKQSDLFVEDVDDSVFTTKPVDPKIKTSNVDLKRLTFRKPVLRSKLGGRNRRKSTRHAKRKRSNKNM
jgi:hypothetical protein